MAFSEHGEPMASARYWLKPNANSEIPRLWVFVDTETYPDPDFKGARYGDELHRFRCGHAIRCKIEQGRIVTRAELAFTDPAEFWEWLYARLQKKNPTWVIAHNWVFGARSLRLWEEIGAGRLAIDRPGKEYTDEETGKQKTTRPWQGQIVIGRNPFIVECDSKFGRANFIDSCNYFPEPLRTLGHSCGTPKGQTPEFTEPLETWQTYCRTDATILETAITRLVLWWKSFNQGNWQATVSGLAFGSYRHKFMHKKILKHDNEEATELERAGYYGGEFQYWYLGKARGLVYHLDVNSLYPYVMANEKHPCELYDVGGPVEPETVAELLKNYWVVARVDIDAPWGECPRRTKAGITYPVGTFQTTLAGLELVQAIENGSVTKVWRYALYRQDDLFGGFVSYWWNYRLEQIELGNKTLAKFAKAILTNLSGKFGQHVRPWEIDRSVYVPDQWTEWTMINAQTGKAQQCRSIGWTPQVQGEPKESGCSIPSIAASITAGGRVRMRNFRALCPVNSVYQQLADGLFVNQDGFDALNEANCIEDGALGKLRIVGVATDLEIRGSSNYRFMNDDHVAGVPQSAEVASRDTWRFKSFGEPLDVFQRKPDGTIDVTLKTVFKPSSTSRCSKDFEGWVPEHYRPRSKVTETEFAMT